MITQNEIDNANSMDIVSYLKSHGMSVKRVGSAYEWESPTGKVSIKGNRWYSQYELVGGYPVNFVMKYFGLKFTDAVESLTGKSYSIMAESYQKEEKEKKQFVVPERHENMNRAFFYLRDERGIDTSIINAFANAGLLFEDSEYHNAVFVGKDAEGNIRHIHKRATSPDSTFKGNAEASNPEYSFNWRGKSNRLFVFEAPIDMLSYITLHQNGWRNNSYISLCSTAGIAAMKMLNDNHSIDTVYLCLDNDNAGTVGSQKLAEKIHSLGEYDVWRLYPENKDWNEDLISIKQQEIQNKITIGGI
jgi:hypothetical protein